MTKEKAMEVLRELPAEFDVEELIERIIFIEKVEKGLHQDDQGQTISHEEIKASAKKWRK